MFHMHYKYLLQNFEFRGQVETTFVHLCYKLLLCKILKKKKKHKLCN